MNSHNRMSAEAFQQRVASLKYARHVLADDRQLITRERLATDVAAFVARGGAIQVIPVGVSVVAPLRDDT